MNKEPDLLEIIKQIHYDSHHLCKQAFGKYFPIAGNIGVFSQNDQEYDRLLKIKSEITEPSQNPNQKYFLFKQPILIPSSAGIPDRLYTHLYIRKPDPTPYGQYRGDIDFLMQPDQYSDLKNLLVEGAVLKGAQIYGRPGWDMIQLTDPDINAVIYVCTKDMAQKVRLKF